MVKNNIKLGTTIILIFLLTSLVLGCIGEDEEKKEEDEQKTILTIIQPSGIENTFSLSELQEMTAIEREISYQNKMGNYVGEGTYKAVPIKDLLMAAWQGTRGDAGSSLMKPGDTLRISAEDGYFQEYCYYNVYPPSSWYHFQGDFGIAYSMDGNSVPAWETGPMAVFLPIDGKYSADDSNATSAPGQGYFKSSSAGARFVKNVVKLEIISNSVDEWEIELSGTISEKFSKTDFEILEQYYVSNYTDDTGDNWSGIPLWHIIGCIDDEGPIRGEGAFNEALSAEVYNIQIKDGDGVSTTISSSSMAMNDKIILANKVNGESLTGDNKPVRLVGEGLTENQRIGNIVSVTIQS